MESTGGARKGKIKEKKLKLKMGALGKSKEKGFARESLKELAVNCPNLRDTGRTL